MLPKLQLNWTTVHVPVYMNRRGMQLLTEVCLMLWTVRENFQDIMLLLTTSVGDHGTWKYSWIHCTVAVFKLIEWWFCQMRLRLQNQDFIRTERQSGNTLSNHQLTWRLNGLIFSFLASIGIQLYWYHLRFTIRRWNFEACTEHFEPFESS